MRSKKIIIAGGRNLEVSNELILALVHQFKLPMKAVEIVSGGCPTGVDKCGERFAKEILLIEPKLFPADWSKHGRAAGPIRNREMALYADILLLIWNGDSSGSMDMQQTMLRLNKPVYETILTRS